MLTTEQLAGFRLQLLKEKEEIEERLEQNGHYGLERGHFHESMGSYQVMIIILLMKVQSCMNVKRILR